MTDTLCLHVSSGSFGKEFFFVFSEASVYHYDSERESAPRRDHSPPRSSRVQSREESLPSPLRHNQVSEPYIHPLRVSDRRGPQGRGLLGVVPVRG